MVPAFGLDVGALRRNKVRRLLVVQVGGWEAFKCAVEHSWASYRVKITTTYSRNTSYWK